MTNSNQAEIMAGKLRAALLADGVKVTQSKSLELIGAALGEAQSDIADEDDIRFTVCCPILRMFDEAKAREFYCDFLGFNILFEHRFTPELPLYLGLERAGLQLHLSEHHGDGTPGTVVFVWMEGIEAFHRELTEKRYKYGRPGLENAPWGKELVVHDPFGNRIRFCEKQA